MKKFLAAIAAMAALALAAGCNDKTDGVDRGAATVAPTIATVTDEPSEQATTDAPMPAPTTAEPTTPPAITTPPTTKPPAPTSGYGVYQIKDEFSGATLTITAPAAKTDKLVSQVEAFRAKAKGKPASYVSVVIDNKKGTDDSSPYELDIVNKDGATAKLESGSSYVNDLEEPFLKDIFSGNNDSVVEAGNTLSETLQNSESTHPGAVNEMLFVLPDVATLPVPEHVFIDDDAATLTTPAAVKPAADVHSTTALTSDAQAACGTAYGLMTSFGADPTEANYRAALDRLPSAFGAVDGPVGDAGRTLTADWQRYSAKFLSGGALTDGEADVVVGDILDLATACEGAGQPAWHL